MGLIATAAFTTLINNKKSGLDFVRALWNAKLEQYYDDLLYLFNLMHLNGKYQNHQTKMIGSF
ncbi:hypothetical protein GCM10023229_03260 [Flavisolibacter ginsenosidimutans]